MEMYELNTAPQRPTDTEKNARARERAREKRAREKKGGHASTSRLAVWREQGSVEGREQGAFARRPCSGGGRGGLVTLVQASNFGDNSRQGEAVEGGEDAADWRQGLRSSRSVPQRTGSRSRLKGWRGTS